MYLAKNYFINYFIKMQYHFTSFNPEEAINLIFLLNEKDDQSERKEGFDNSFSKSELQNEWDEFEKD